MKHMIKFPITMSPIRKTLLITAVITAGLLLLLGYINHYSAWPPAENPPHQGEALDPAALRNGVIIHSAKALGQLVREPQNTWSNMAFILGGSLLISLGTTRCGRLAGAMLIAVGAGSFLYHASASRTLRHGDVAAMYGLYFITMILCVGATWPSLRRKFEKHAWLIAMTSLLVAVGAACGRNFVVFGFKPLELTLVTAIVVAVLVATFFLTIKRRRDLKTFSLVATALALFGISVVCQLGDRPGRWLCNPDAFIQGHALWHLFSAAAFVVVVFLLEQNTHAKSI